MTPPQLAMLSNAVFVLLIFALGVHFAYLLGLARGLSHADRWKAAAKVYWRRVQALRETVEYREEMDRVLAERIDAYQRVTAND